MPTANLSLTGVKAAPVWGRGATMAPAAVLQRPGIAASDAFPNITAPSGSASFTANWGAQVGADGYLVFLNDGAYRYKAAGQSTSSLLISGIASGAYTWRVATYEGSTVGDLSGQVPVTAA